MPKKKPTAAVSSPESEPGKEVVRVTFRLHGAELEQMREVRDMLSLNSELDAARYLMQRGLEAMSSTLASRKASKLMAAAVNPAAITQGMVDAMLKAGYVPGEENKP